MSNGEQQARKLEADLALAYAIPMPKFYQNDEGRIFEANEEMHINARKLKLRPYHGRDPQDLPVQVQTAAAAISPEQELARATAEIARLTAALHSKEAESKVLREDAAEKITNSTGVSDPAKNGFISAVKVVSDDPNISDAEIAAFKDKFGRAPHPNASAETIRKKLSESA